LKDPINRKEVVSSVLQNVQRDLLKTRRELEACMRDVMPSKEFGSTLMLAVLRLHQIEAAIRKTKNIEERRKLIHAFNKGRTTIEKSLRLLKENGTTKTNGERGNLGRAMP
jgi:hypothetical protein